jgi:amino-acid N-acetyltransferase
MKIRRARAADAAAIHRLIALYAAQGLLLPRELAEVRAKIRNFLVLEDTDEFVGCVALETYGRDLAEIRSLALVSEARSQGLGRRLLESAKEEAKRREIARVFAVTQSPLFFVRHGFQLRRQQIPHEKIESDCRNCPKAASCERVTVVAEVIPERLSLRVLEPAAAPLPA